MGIKDTQSSTKAMTDKMKDEKANRVHSIIVNRHYRGMAGFILMKISGGLIGRLPKSYLLYHLSERRESGK